MKLTKNQHADIYNHLENISKMKLNDLRAFDEKWNFNKPDLDSKVFDFVNRGVVSQLAYLMEMSEISPMAVASEMILDDGSIER